MTFCVSIGWALTLSALLAGSERTVYKPCPLIAEMSETEKLLVIRCATIGARPNDIAKLVPDFDTVGPYAGVPSLSVGSTRLTLFNHELRLQFNFKADSLYGMFYSIELPAAEGDSVFGRLVHFYSQHYGPERVADGQDSPYFVKNRRWCTPAYEVTVGCSLAGDHRLLGWGFQTSAVACIKPVKREKR